MRAIQSTTWVSKIATLFTMVALMTACFSGCRRDCKVAVYDNQGGFAYAGYRITFFPSGQYLSESYTDVKGERPHAEKGPYRKNGDAYILGGVGGQKTFHLLKVEGVEYLLDHFTYEDYIRTKDSDKLREAMRRGA